MVNCTDQYLLKNVFKTFLPSMWKKFLAEKCTYQNTCIYYLLYSATDNIESNMLLMIKWSNKAYWHWYKALCSPQGSNCNPFPGFFTCCMLHVHSEPWFKVPWNGCQSTPTHMSAILPILLSKINGLVLLVISDTEYPALFTFCCCRAAKGVLWLYLQ